MSVDPSPGLVIRYHYLWKRRQSAGHVEAEKARPCAIVVVVERTRGRPIVTVVPMTHSRPRDDDEAIELPAVAARAAGLDWAPVWVILNEVNSFEWPGPDLSNVPGRTPDTFVYGRLSGSLFSSIKKRLADIIRARRIDIVGR